MKAYLAILAAVAIAIAIGILAWKLNAGAGWKAKATTATQQAENNAEAVRQVDHFTHTTEIIRERTDDAVQSVQAAPGGDAPLPDDVRRAWADGIDGMRRPADSTAADGAGDVPR